MQCFLKRYNYIESNQFIDYNITHYYDFSNLSDGSFSGNVTNKYSAPEKLNIQNGIVDNGKLTLNGAGNNSYAIANANYTDNSNIIVYGVSELISIISSNWVMSISDENNVFAVGMGRITEQNTYVSNYIQSTSRYYYTNIQITKPIAYCYTNTVGEKPIFFAKGIYNDFTKIPIEYSSSSTIKSEVVLGGYVTNNNKIGGAKTAHNMVAIGNAIHTDKEIESNIEYLYQKYIVSNP